MSFKSTIEYITHDSRRVLALFVVLAMVLYGQTIGHDYALDDTIVIVENDFTQQGVQGLRDIFRYDSFRGFFGESQNYVPGGRYRPLSIATFALEVQLFGSNPGLSHAVNVLLYGLLCYLLFRVLTLILHRHSAGRMIALGATLLYAVHPVHTEVVANIKGRDEIFCFLFSLLAWKVLLRSRLRPIHWVSACFFFLLALLSKENAITMAVVIPVGVYFYDTSRSRAPLYSFVLLTALGLLYWLGWRQSIVGSGSSEVIYELMNNPFLSWDGARYVEMNFSERWHLVGLGLGKYLQLLVWPHPLTHDYYPRYFGVSEGIGLLSVISIGLYLAIAIGVMAGFRQKKIWSLGLLLFMVPLSIYSNILVNVGTHLSERFLFVPSVGYCLLVSWLLEIGFRQKSGIQKLLPWVLTAALIALALLTILRNKAWKDDFTLFTTDVHTSSQSAKVNNAAGGVLLDRANTLGIETPEAQSLTKRAILHLDRAIEIHPRYRNAYLLKGNAHCYLGEYEQSLEQFYHIREHFPAYENVQKNIVACGLEAAEHYAKNQKNPTKAIDLLQQLKTMAPSDANIPRLLGLSHAVLNQNEEAMTHFSEALRLDPQNAFVHYNLGVLYHNMGNKELGDQYWAKAEQLQSGIVPKRNPSGR